MNKPGIPRGVTKKEKCPKCGRMYWNFMEGRELRNICTICKPVEEKKKK